MNSEKKLSQPECRRPLKLLLLFLLVCSFGQALFAQGSRQISGTVIQAGTSLAMPGITVLEKGSTNGTITDQDGHYTLSLSSSSATVMFSFIGMKTVEVRYTGQAVIDVVMEEAAIDLEEVVAIGYGTMKKSDLTGAVGSVKVDEMMKTPVSSFDQSLQGRVAGVQVMQLSAQPGGSTMFRIRGGSSIYAGNQPLYVIDGMMINSNDNMSWLGTPTINALSSLNPNDIESIEVLKDASATSIYGAKGANGVIIITTRRGKEGSDRVTFESYFGMQEISRRIEVMNATQFAILYDEAGAAAAADNGTTYVPLYPDPESLGEGTDWQDEIYRVAPTQNYAVSASGGSEKTQYALSANYFRQDGIIVGSDFSRYSFRTNVDHQASKRLKVGTSFTLNRTKANTVGSSTQAGFFPGVVNTALTFSPALPIYDSTGQYTLKDPNADAWLDNPVAVTREVTSIDQTFKFIGNAYANYTIAKGLDFRVTIGLDQYTNEQDYYDPSFIYSGSFNDGQARFAYTSMNTFLNENTLSYNRTFDDKHQLSAVAGFTYQKRDSRTFIDIASGFPNDRLEAYGIATAENIPDILTGFGEEAIISYLARFNYTLSGKYMLTLTDRVDGSSKFGPNNKFANFPSLAVAWRISSEPFMERMDKLYNFKLRASIGTSGNDAIPSYLYIPTMTNTVYYFSNSGPYTGFVQQVVGNDDLRWETTRQIDLGTDLSFYRGRLSFVFDYYNKFTYDMLYYAEVPNTSGFNTALINVGSMVNNGIELTLNTVNFEGAFSWNTDISFSANKSRVVDLNNNDATYISDDTYKLKIGYWSIIAEGEELGSFYGLVSDGIWQTEEAELAALYGAQPGDFKYVDQNTDYKIDAEDRQIIGHAQPDFFWSINNTLSYRNFELTVYIQGVQGNQILNSNRFELESGNGLSNASIAMLNRWTEENQSDIYPRANRNADYLYMSDRYLEDGSYARLQLLSLGYRLPETVYSKLKIKGAKVYISAKNLYTLTSYSGFDPEVGRFGASNIRQGYDLGSYPAARTYLMGVNIDF